MLAMRRSLKVCSPNQSIKPTSTPPLRQGRGFISALEREER